jgi:thioesterase domain-containing protein
VLVSVQAHGTAPPLFLVPGHEGHAVGFTPLSRRLGADQPFYGLHPTGWSEDPLSLIPLEATATHCLEAVRAVQPHGPYYLGGRCYGGVLAFELAQQLAAGGERVGLLLLVDVTPEDFPGLVSEEARRRFRRDRLLGDLGLQERALLKRSVWKRPPYVARAVVRSIRRTISRVGRRAALRLSIAMGRSLPGRPRDGWFLNQEAARSYAPRTYPGRVTLILRAEDVSMYSSDPTLDWKHLAAGGYDIHYLPTGGGMFREPGVQALAELLAAALRAARV